MQLSGNGHIISSNTMCVNVTNINIKDFKSSIKIIMNSQVVVQKYMTMYYASGHKNTCGYLNQITIEYEHLVTAINNIRLVIDNSLSWFMLHNMVHNLIKIVNYIINLLPDIPDGETYLQYTNRKLQMKIFQMNIPNEISNLKILGMIINKMIYIKDNQNAMTFDDSIVVIEEFYIYPFWYKFNTGLNRFRDLIDLFKCTFLASHDYVNFLKPFGMLTGAVNNMYSKTQGSYASTKKTFDLVNENKSIELLQYMWNQGEIGIGSKAVSLTLPRINIANWIKIIYESSHIECLILANSLPFEIPSDNIIDPVINKTINQTNINIILHMHGGGFVSGSPHTHEVYLRKWAINTNTVIFSVNYSKSPNVQFPVALDECYHIYKILVDGHVFGFIPNKIILAGDSAGGNLAMTTTIKAIKDNIRIPDGLILAYPAIDCDKSITLSRYLFSYDVLLSYNLLLLCANAYLLDGIDPKNELISPLYVSDDVLSKFPNDIFIHSAGYCPLLDDSVKFVERLKKNNKSVQHWLYELPHGFWNMCYIIPQVNDIIEQTCEQINCILLKNSDESSNFL